MMLRFLKKSLEPVDRWASRGERVATIASLLGLVVLSLMEPWFWVVLFVSIALLFLTSGLKLQSRLDELEAPAIRPSVDVISSRFGYIVRVKLHNDGPPSEFSARFVALGNSTEDTWKVPWSQDADETALIAQGDHEYLYLLQVSDTGLSPLRVGLGGEGFYRIHNVRALPTEGMACTVDIFSTGTPGAIDRVTIQCRRADRKIAAVVLRHDHKVVGDDWETVGDHQGTVGSTGA